ncbi:MAG: response regulator [Thermodesulfobacteriota bacterium]
MKTLIVEDDATNRQMLVEFLSQYGPVHEAANGFAALDLFTEAHNQGSPFNLVCLDIMMPDLDGQKTLKEIREIETDRDIASAEIVKVIMLTGLIDKENITTAFIDGGCHAYLTKPVTTKEIISQLEELELIEPQAKTSNGP